jgi:hypothetical protein
MPVSEHEAVLLRVDTAHARDLDGALDRAEKAERALAAARQVDEATLDAMVIRAREVLKGHVREGILGDYLRAALLAALNPGDNADDTLPPDLRRILRDPSITIDKDHECRLADGRTLFQHLEEWRNAPSNTASADPNVEGE